MSSPHYIHFSVALNWISDTPIPSDLKRYSYYGSSLKKAISILRAVRKKYDIEVDAYLETCYCRGNIFNVVYREPNYEF